MYLTGGYNAGPMVFLKCMNVFSKNYFDLKLTSKRNHSDSIHIN